MNNKFKLPLFLLSIFFLLSAFIKSVNASEGTVQLRSTTGESYRCFAVSLFMQNNSYDILISCRDLIYPVGEELTGYVVWGTPTDGDDPFKLGELGIGKADFSTRNQFSNLFVTTEVNPRRVRSPEGRVVMQGGVQPIEFLGPPAEPSPTPELSQDQETEDTEIPEPEGEDEEEQTQLSTRERLVLGLKRAGIVAFFALIAIIGLIFVITRSRG